MSDGGFHDVMALSEARQRLLERCQPHRRRDRLAVADADGHVLAEAVRAARAVPHYDRAAMDGFAVRAADTFGASERSPVTLSLADGRVADGEAVQVHTGSAMPAGADAVVMVEQTERRDDAVLVSDAVAAAENVAPTGEDVARDARLFAAGHRLSPSDLALLRTTGHDSVSVVDPPRVSVVPTGEEVVPAGSDPAPGEVVETNGLLVSTLAERWGATATHRDVVTDDETALRRAIEADTDHDVVVTTGGSSVGERDLVADVVETAGTVLVHGVAIHPGHPVGVGVVDETVVVMCPGYPVSCLVAAVQFLRPAIAALEGVEPRPHPTTRGRLGEKIRSRPGRRTFARVRVADRSADGLPTVEPIRTGGAGVLSSVTTADGWVVVPESREGIPAEERVAVQEWERAPTRPRSE